MQNKNNYTILVVDDDESSRGALVRLLDMDGYITEQAADGREALEKISLKDYDVIITDMKMPRVGGLDFIKNIRDSYQGRIIVMTAFGTADTFCKALDLGAFEFINKPAEYDNLLCIIREITKEG